MVYALNVFNLIPGHESEYRDYSVKAGKIIRMTGLRAPVLVDRGSRLIRSFGGNRVPYTLVLNPTGKATALFIGKQNPKRFETALDREFGELDEFLENASVYAPGSTKSIRVADAEERRKIIDYLKSELAD